ncbi:MAG: SUMF1/EgtB/PvdO family nonheme iron enzyme [Nitrospirae bacterium]|nr:SUMF1/EgtB/PvdO family nonheme iron enzyme [Nitrospirota bacterium]
MNRLPAILLCAALGLLPACDRGGAPPPAPPSDAARESALSEAHRGVGPAPPEVRDGADMVPVPGGPFVFGSDREDPENRSLEYGGRRVWYADEHPQATPALAPFRIDRTEVTEGAYKRFVDAIGYPPPPHWAGKEGMPERPDYPIVNVNWMDAQNYCHWRGARLPTEREWEKAARGTGGAEYPWGDAFDRDRANVGQVGDLTPAGHFAESASPYGAVDMAGNVWEWVADWYAAYPGNPLQSPLFGKRYKVVRGGSSGGQGGHYQLEALTNRAAYRFFLDPRMQVPDVGFRCAQGLDANGRPVDDHARRLHGATDTP